MRQIVLDTETTGLSPENGHRVIEIGCVEMVNRRLTGSTLHFYLNPQRVLDEGAVAVHGLTAEFLGDKPLFADIANDLIDYINDAELIIHNAPFDVGFLNYEFKLLGKNFKQIKNYCRVCDTLKLARAKHPGQHNSLDALCKRYQVDNSKRDLHGALLDAELLAQVYLQLTGGQTQLFQQEDEVKPKAAQCALASNQLLDLPIIAANSSELQAHQDILNNLKKSGKCLWLEQDDN